MTAANSSAHATRHPGLRGQRDPERDRSAGSPAVSLERYGLRVADVPRREVRAAPLPAAEVDADRLFAPLLASILLVAAGSLLYAYVEGLWLCARWLLHWLLAL